ncbi:radical SAM protein [Nannocystis sp.]|uniref:radical SAM protein n=1 Tax=Nannocystis sp. TaxID=1962667 RepID=UPI0025E594CF|nr:radical SAM protein [Nannocystis sp.]MBK7824310.1 radical SAM protein [Nannocystis sp.]
MTSPSRAPGYPGARRAVKALIKVGYGCNEHCSFCHTQAVREIQGSSAEVEAKIRRAAELYRQSQAPPSLAPGSPAQSSIGAPGMIVLSGGEPTIRPELLHWADLVASLDMDLGLVTNGLLLAYPDRVDALLRRRLRYVYLSLHGGSARVHNLMVRTEAFAAAIAALRNLSGRGLDLHVNCVVTRHNLAHLRGLVDAVLPFPDLTLKFSMMEPKGGGDRLFDHLMPRVSDVAEKIQEAIAHGEAHAGSQGPRFEHGGLPLCLLPGRERQYGDLRTHRYRTMIEVGEPDYFPVDDLNKRHPPACAGCSLRGPCPGLFHRYHEVHGDAELRPRPGPRANAFNYTLAVLPPVPADMSEATCPLRDGPLGVTPWDRGRDLFIRHAGKLALHRADTRDFSDAEIADIKHTRGQIYLDATRKPAPDDFARDLIPLRRAPLCAGCPHERSCTGLFEPVLEDMFTHDDARVRAHLATLRGELLDLGCGEAPYLEALRPALAAGTLRYLGQDPDPAALAALAPRLDGLPAELHAGPAAAAPDRRLDHLTILRSWNHLPDPAADLALLLPRLRPGGSLTVVDNLGFGLARSPAQTARAEASSARWEHHRSDDAGQAHARILAAAATCGVTLQLHERSEISPATSNQWLLRYTVA